MNSRLWSGRWWRWFSPANLIGTAVVFCLPWMDVRCDSTFGEVHRSATVLRQSGFQAALGGRFTSNHAGLDTLFPGAGLLRSMYGTHADDDSLRSASPARQLAAFYHGAFNRESAALPGQQAALARAREQARKPCWLLVAYGGLVGVGILGGVLLPAGRRRAPLLAALGGACLVVLAAQTSAGYPVQVWVEAENAALRAVHEEYVQMVFAEGPPELVMSHTWTYAVAFALPAIIVVAAVAEWILCRCPVPADGAGVTGHPPAEHAA